MAHAQVSTIYLVVVFFDGKVHVWEIVGFFVIYFVYVAVVIIFRKQSAEVYEDAVALRGGRER